VNVSLDSYDLRRIARLGRIDLQAPPGPNDYLICEAVAVEAAEFARKGTGILAGWVSGFLWARDHPHQLKSDSTEPAM